MRLRELSMGLLFALLTGMAGVLPAAEDVPLHEWGDHKKEELYEGAITIEAADGSRKVMKTLGGPLGKEVVDGIEVGLFVLQASNPERLKPGAEGPTHIFNVTFMDEGGSKLITDALGAVIIDRTGAETQRKSFRLTGKHHQAQVRLEGKGEYQVSVEFVTGSHKGKTQSMLFNYTGEFMFPGHDHHNH
ncbi:MAG: hypothetical protein JSW45_09535 [Thiotrichales bacterium]|nr:MAG: hypothetical protein JSW45_09535 [Thiotrichales bacterium]